MFWHDHATLANRGFLKIILHTLRDKPVHLSDKEYDTKTRQKVNVQSEVKQPEVHMLVLGNSSVEDQAAVISDRLECIQEVANPLITQG